ncbi:MAG: Hsp70 family protein [Burkholderiaceae bacterium]
MPTAPPADYCAIDFGTSNSAVAVPAADAMALVPLEPEHGERGRTMPTAVFYLAEGPGLQNLPKLYGRAAVAAYVEGTDGRLMRSMKSALGSALMEQHTDVGAGRSVAFGDVIASYLLHLRRAAQAHAGREIERVVLGRPVFFVDEDASRDAAAQAGLEAAARSVGFRDVHFQYEPIAAAFHYEQQVDREQVVIVADIGGGTSDFSVVRVGPQRIGRADRRDDILASHGVHVAGTDFDRHVELARILPALGYGAYGPPRAGRAPLEVPSRIYFDLTTWHLINLCYRPQRLMEIASMRDDYADPRHHARLTTVLRERLGHALAGLAEEAKIAVAQGGAHAVDLFEVERALEVEVTEAQVVEAVNHDLGRIVQAAGDTARLAGLHADEIDALYFTGGSTGLRLLAERLAAAFPQARPVHGDRFASVATGLGLDARRRFG